MPGRINQNVAYSLNQPLSQIPNNAVVARRDPQTTDFAPIGQEWVNVSTNAVFFLSSIVGNSANWVNVSGGSATFVNVHITGTLTVDGITTLNGATTVNNSLTVNGVFTANDGMQDVNSSNNASGPTLAFYKNRAGAIVHAGDNIMDIFANGFDGANNIDAGGIQMVVAGTPGVNRIGSTMSFLTHPDSTAAASVKMTIDNTGKVTVLNPDTVGDVLVTSSGNIRSGNAITADLGNITATNGNFVASTAGTGVVLGGGAKVLSGAGDPNGAVSAPQGSLYLNTTGSGVADRAWINTNGLTTWTFITTGA